MTDSLLNQYFRTSYTTIVPFPVPTFSPEPGSALDLLHDEADGFAIEATVYPATVAVIDTGTPANNLSDVALDASNLVQSGTSPKMVHFTSSPYVRWSPHNLFLNSATPATQNVTLVTGFVYTVTVTGAGGGNITGSSGASGTATTGSPATFTATGTTGTFTLTGSLDTIRINRGSVATDYLATTGSIRYGIPQSYDTAASKYGIWGEPAATNLSQRSEELNNAYWADDGGGVLTVTADNTTAPDGNTTADKLTAGNNSGFHGRYATNSTTTANTNYTASCYVKAVASERYISIVGVAGADDWYAADFDLNSPTAPTQTTNGTSGTVAGGTITAIGNSWYRITLTGQHVSSATRIAISAVNSATPTHGSFGNVTWTPAASEAFYVWGAQLELGNVATSYIHTISATATRGADVIAALDTTFPGSDTNNTIYLDYKPLTVASGTRYAWAYWKDANNFYSLAGVTANPTMGNTNAGSPEFAVDIGTLVAGTRTQITIAAKGNDFDGSQDGAAATAQGTATLTTAYTTLYLGTFGTTGSELNGFIYRMVIVPYQRETVSADLETWRYNF